MGREVGGEPRGVAVARGVRGVAVDKSGCWSSSQLLSRTANTRVLAHALSNTAVVQRLHPWLAQLFLPKRKKILKKDIS